MPDTDTPAESRRAAQYVSVTTARTASPALLDSIVYGFLAGQSAESIAQSLSQLIDFTKPTATLMQPEDGHYEPLLGYIALEQSQAAVDLLGHRLVHVKRLDLS